jgi:hypothetical protein
MRDDHVLDTLSHCGLAGRYVAKNKGRSRPNWFLISIFVSPLLGLIAVAALPRVESNNPQRGTKLCPKCAETVKLGADVCRHCGYEFKETTETYLDYNLRVRPNGKVDLIENGRPVKTYPSMADFKRRADRKAKRAIVSLPGWR